MIPIGLTSATNVKSGLLDQNKHFSENKNVTKAYRLPY
jgi:hypothetical protein